MENFIFCVVKAAYTTQSSNARFDYWAHIHMQINNRKNIFCKKKRVRTPTATFCDSIIRERLIKDLQRTIEAEEIRMM